MYKSLFVARAYLHKTVCIEIDRPLGSRHPRYADLVYPVNYGFVPETRAPDGAELDAYVLGVDKALEEFSGTCIAIIHRLNDDDDKLVVVPEGVQLSDEEIHNLLRFQEQYFQIQILRA